MRTMMMSATLKVVALAELKPVFALLEGWKDFLARLWQYINDVHKIGNLQLSVTTILEGVLIFIVALFLSRTLSAFLQRRIAKRAYIDPGLSYTLGRLTQYLILTIDRKSTRLNSSHTVISYAVFCLKKKTLHP